MDCNELIRSAEDAAPPSGADQRRARFGPPALLSGRQRTVKRLAASCRSMRLQESAVVAARNTFPLLGRHVQVGPAIAPLTSRPSGVRPRRISRDRALAHAIRPARSGSAPTGALPCKYERV